MRDKNNPGLYEQDDLSPQDLLDIQHPMIKLDDGRKVVSMKSATGLSWEAISDGLLVIEWFPYHAKRSALLSKPYSPRRTRRFPAGVN